MSEEIDKGYSEPAHVYKKGMYANYYEGEDLNENLEDKKMNENKFFDSSDKIGLFWDSDEMAKKAGEPVYLIEHNNEIKWLHKKLMHKYTSNADDAWFTCDREKAEAMIKDAHSVYQDLPVHVSEHIFEASNE